MVNDSSNTNEDSSSSIASSIGYMVGAALIKPMVEMCVTSKNYILFSLTKFTYDGKTRTVGIGAFGNVWIFSEID